MNLRALYANGRLLLLYVMITCLFYYVGFHRTGYLLDSDPVALPAGLNRTGRVVDAGRPSVSLPPFNPLVSGAIPI